MHLAGIEYHLMDTPYMYKLIVLGFKYFCFLLHIVISVILVFVLMTGCLHYCLAWLHAVPMHGENEHYFQSKKKISVSSVWNKDCMFM